jgi:P-aminobenzoate N-oxygenase AurF
MADDEATEPMKLLDRADATTWDGLSRLAFAADWDPERAIDWSRPVELGAARDAWIEILHQFHEGEWQGLEIIQRLMNRAAHRYRADGMITYYSTQCYDESKHLFVFRRYLAKVGAPPARRRTFDLLVALATRGPLAVERWILATWFTETFAAAVFQAALATGHIDPTARDMIRLMLKDESRHIAGTRLALRAVIERSGPLRTVALAAWWRLFLRLAVNHVRTLRAAGQLVGIDADEVLADALKRMASMERFSRTFLAGWDVNGRFLAKLRRSRNERAGTSSPLGSP